MKEVQFVRVLRTLFGGVATIICIANASAEIRLSAVLAGNNEVPPNGSLAFGTGSFELAGNTLSFRVDVFGAASVMESFIHGPAELGQIGEPVVNLGIPHFVGFCDRCTNAHLPQYIFGGTVPLSRQQIRELLAGKLYVNIHTETFPNGEVRGQIFPSDDDGDGVPNYLDLCPNTPIASVVDSTGCTIGQRCPCEGPWKSHGEYVGCVSRAAAKMRREGLIDDTDRRNVVISALRSDCGRRR